MSVVMRSEQCDRLLDTLHKMHAMPYEHTKTLITSKVWKEFASALSTILTLVPHAINNTPSSSYNNSSEHHKDDTLLSALGNASSVLSLATNALISADKQQHQDTPSSPSTSKLRRRITSTVKSRAALSRTVTRKAATTTTSAAAAHSSPFPPFSSQQQTSTTTPALYTLDADIERVQRISYDVLLLLQQLIMQLDCMDEYHDTDVSAIHASLIARVEQLVDALLGMSSPPPPPPVSPLTPRVKTLYNSASSPNFRKSNNDRAMDTKAVHYNPNRHSMSHESYTCTTKHVSQQQQKRSTGTVGFRFMRSISSSFRSSHANASFSRDLKQHHRSPSPPPIPPRSSISSLSFSEPTTTSSDCDSVPRLIHSVGSASFDENDSISTWSTSKSATPSSSMATKQQRSSSTKTSAMRAIRMLFGSAIIRPVTIITKQDQKIREAQQQQPITSSRNSSHHHHHRHYNSKRWSQISSSDTTTTASARSACFLDGDDDGDDTNQCRLINSRRLSGSGIPLLFTPTTSLGLNTSKFWEEIHSKNEQDEVFLSSTYGPISPLHVDTTTTSPPQGIEDTTEASSARSKDALSTTSSSYFSARSSYSSDSSLRCLSSQGVSDSKQQHRVDNADMVQQHEEEYRHASIYDSNNNNNNESISDKATTTTTGHHHPLRSTLLSKAMLLADNNSPQPQHVPNYHSVGTIGIGNLSSVLSKQWMLHSMRAIKSSSSSNNHHRAPIPSMLQQSSTERPMTQRSMVEEDISLLSNKDDYTYIEENGHVTMILETRSRCKCVVVAGTCNKLTEKLADDGVQDFDYIDTYLQSHASFISSVDLLDQLAKRFNSTVQSCIQIKLLNVMERWVKFQYDDFKNDRLLLRKLYAFLTSSEEKRPELQKELGGIRDALSMQIARDQGRSPLLYHRRSLDSSAMSTPLLMPSRNMSSTTLGGGGGGIVALSSTLSVLSCLEAKQVAQYLTLADFHIFKSINAYEYMRGHWRTMRRGEPLSATDSYTRILTIRANMLHHWILHEVCSPKMPKQQRTILRKLIQVAKLCIEWNNFHTAMNIILALQSQTIQRLHNTWAMLSSRDLTAFQTLQQYVDVSNNMGHYRQALADVQAPAVPFFPLVLKDLVFHMDGNSTILSRDQHGHDGMEEPLVNFGKFRAVTRMIATLTQLTSQDYWFAADLDHCPFLPNAPITRPPQCHPTTSTHVPPLDRVAELVEIKLRAVESCYDDPRCSIVSVTASSQSTTTAD